MSVNEIIQSGTVILILLIFIACYQKKIITTKINENEFKKKISTKLSYACRRHFNGLRS